MSGSSELCNLSPEKQESLDGSPALVRDEAGFISLRFQCGPIKEHGVNGTTIEDVIDVLIARLQGFNAGPFRCRQNSLAITALEEAQNWLYRRTLARIRAGTEGTNIVSEGRE